MNVVKNLVLSVTAFGFALVAAEGLLRFVLVAPPRLIGIDTNNGNEEVEIAWDNLTLITPSGTRLRPNAHVKILNERLTGRDIEIHTNSLGYRNRELQQKTLTRVLFLGDSITFEDYAHEPETWVRQIEVRSWKTAYPLETINAAKGGLSMSDELAILEETGISTQPDVVVLGFYLNDLRESYGFHVGQLPGLLDRSYLAWFLSKSINLFHVHMEIRRFRSDEMHVFAAEIAHRVPPNEGNSLRDQGAFYREVIQQLQDWGGSFSDLHWQFMTPLFERFRALADRYGFLPLIVVFPVHLQVHAEFLEDFPQRKIAAIARRLDIPLLDLLPILRQVRLQNERNLFHDHCHYTQFGDEVISEAVLNFINDNTKVRAFDQIPKHLMPTTQVSPEFDNYILH